MNGRNSGSGLPGDVDSVGKAHVFAALRTAGDAM